MRRYKTVYRTQQRIPRSVTKRTVMLQQVWNLFFGKPLTEEQRRWATVLAVSIERVR